MKYEPSPSLEYLQCTCISGGLGHLILAALCMLYLISQGNPTRLTPINLLNVHWFLVSDVKVATCNYECLTRCTCTCIPCMSYMHIQTHQNPRALYTVLLPLIIESVTSDVSDAMSVSLLFSSSKGLLRWGWTWACWTGSLSNWSSTPATATKHNREEYSQSVLHNMEKHMHAAFGALKYACALHIYMYMYVHCTCRR